MERLLGAQLLADLALVSQVERIGQVERFGQVERARTNMREVLYVSYPMDWRDKQSLSNPYQPTKKTEAHLMFKFSYSVKQNSTFNFIVVFDKLIKIW